MVLRGEKFPCQEQNPRLLRAHPTYNAIPNFMSIMKSESLLYAKRSGKTMHMEWEKAAVLRQHGI